VSVSLGGFVIGSSKSYDAYLLQLSSKLGVAAVSVEYRLAPEHLYPAAHNDAVDAVRFAVSPEGESQLGGPLKILAGESAGGYLATWAAMDLRGHRGGGGSGGQVEALIVSYPIYDLTFTPSCLSHTREAVLSSEGMRKFVDTGFQNVPADQRKDPDLSLLFADLKDLPPTLFLCGTEDALVDDSAFMAARWSLAGNVAELCLVPGAWHAFTLIPAGEVTDEGIAEIVAFARKHCTLDD
jgi:acetyl esterase/lipase